MRQTLCISIQVSELKFWKRQILYWAVRFEHHLYLDSNERDTLSWECLCGADSVRALETNAGHAFEQLADFQSDTKDWLFGFLGYDLKNEIERLESVHSNSIDLADMVFFQPITVVGIRHQCLEIHTFEKDIDAIIASIKAATRPLPVLAIKQQHRLKARMPKTQYLETVKAIRQHIIEGDLYEMNLCQEFYAENIDLVPVLAFEHLNEMSRPPFAAFLRWRDQYLCSASPERFLKKEGQILTSQPIKGTRKRSQIPSEDEAIRWELQNNEKDRAENVMIVDLVRNDLARHCIPGSVSVPELFGIHTFPTVHQMISTVRGTLRDDTDPIRALRDCFPMGSMTGAPKVMAMQLIENYENCRRGLYSGGVGYFDPSGDFDFNVVIRSILYNQTKRYVSVSVGGAIVYDSVPDQEYEECMVKLEAMRKVIQHD